MHLKSIPCFLLLLVFVSTPALADVTVTSSGGDLWLNVANGNADFSITSFWIKSSNRIRVTGHNGTEIDGQSQRDFAFPTGDLIIERQEFNRVGTASVRIHGVYGMQGNIDIRNVEEITMESSWTTRDIILGCPRNVWIYNVYARDIRSAHDYFANSIDVSYSEFTRNVSLYSRNIDLYDVEVGGSVYLYGTYLSDDFYLYRVEGRTYSQKPTIKSYLYSGNDYQTFRYCRANFVYVHGGYGSDTFYVNNRGNSINSQQRVSVEWVK